MWEEAGDLSSVSSLKGKKVHPELLLFCLLGPERPPKLLSTEGDTRNNSHRSHNRGVCAVQACVLINRQDPVWALACTLNFSTFWNS